MLIFASRSEPISRAAVEPRGNIYSISLTKIKRSFPASARLGSLNSLSAGAALTNIKMRPGGKEKSPTKGDALASSEL